MTTSNIPSSMEKYLDVLQHNRDGSLMLGSSGLTGKFWAGSLWFYEDPGNAPDISKCSAGIQTEAGVTDIQWIDECRVAIASDSGAIEVWQLVNSRSAFRNLFYLYEHDNAVHSISINSNKTRIISGSSDKLIKVWDLATQASVLTLRAHTSKVECITCSPNELEVFLSCSQDGSVLLWDLRKPKPARKLSRPSGTSLPTCTAWKPGETHVFAVGDETGKIVLQDSRADSTGTRLTTAHTRSIHRLAFSPKNPLWLASTSDDCTVAVTELQPELKQIYRSYSHNDFVRGASWDPLSNKLMTCGWDKQVKGHDIVPAAAGANGRV
ncbi:methylosome protein 50-like [Asterias rubens]|uniref:methylosome protein 50-like n=1 Tax=Asterias rubens TaxID=7604 RepID=UPI0014550592|nr:methylosome protein 50-like [Asterias rubens]